MSSATTETREAVDLLVRYIEENVRATGSSGLRFIDPRNHLSRITARQNHIVFGRRGAGKSSLLRSLAHDADAICVRVDMEDLKSITFPNILTHVLLQLSDALTRSLEVWPFWVSPRRWRIRARGRELLEILKQEVQRGDEEDLSVRNLSSGTSTGTVTVGAGSAGLSFTDSVEVSKQHRREKLTFLQNLLPDLKSFIRRVSGLLGGRSIPVSTRC